MHAHLTHQPARLPVGRVDLGDLRRVVPLSRDFGYDRGTPIDRYYIEQFLERHALDVRGRVLEVKDPTYTHRFGVGRVTHSEVVDIDPANSSATIVADLAAADALPADRMDCVVFTQVLQLIYDAPAALRAIRRTLAPGGTLLMTVPGITQIASASLGKTWYWSFSEASVRRMLRDAFPDCGMEIETHGNVLSASALLYGLALEELREEELEYRDPDYQVIITARVTRAPARV